MTTSTTATPTIILFGDIVESNGKTIRENNLSKEHTIPLGAIVRVEYDIGRETSETGVEIGMSGTLIAYVIGYARDYDGSPLYQLATRHPREWPPWPGVFDMTSQEFVSALQTGELLSLEPKTLLVKVMMGLIDGLYSADSLEIVSLDEALGEVES